MAAATALGKRLGLFCFLLFNLFQGRWLVLFAERWAEGWWVNRESIVLLTVINTSITAGSEYVTRTLSSRGEHRFFLSDDKGSYRIHRQSLINIFMTLFASLFGGPVFFFKTWVGRFFFFGAFGLLNSFLSQWASSLIGAGFVALSTRRLTFDLVYGTTMKFLIFEWGRRFILRIRHSALQLGTFRVTQDFISTLVRVAFLNLLGFKG